MKIRALALMVGLFLPLPLIGQAGGGPLDTRFGSNGSIRLDQTPFDESVQDLALDSQGRIYVAFRWRDPGFPDPTWWPAVVRLTPDGVIDVGFGFAGVWVGDVWAAASPNVRIAIDALDRPLIGWTIDSDPGPGEDYAWVVRRLNPGLPYTEAFVQFAWGNSRYETLVDLVVLADGRVLAAGSVDYTVDDYDFALAVWTDDGAGGLVLDTGFSGDGRATVAFDLPGGPKTDRARSVREQGSKLWMIGSAKGESGAFRTAVARIALATGDPDGSFGSGGKANYEYTPLGGSTWLWNVAVDCALRPAGGLVLAGFGKEASGSVARPLAFAIDELGLIEPAWGVVGWHVPDLRYPGFPFDTAWGGYYGVAVDTSGRAMLAGDLGNPSDGVQTRALAVRLTASGSFDSSFSSDGVQLHTFEPGGEPYLDGFAPVMLVDDAKLALVGGWTYGNTSGVPRSDTDVLVARIIVDPLIFADDFESGDVAAWAP